MRATVRRADAAPSPWRSVIHGAYVVSRAAIGEKNGLSFVLGPLPCELRIALLQQLRERRQRRVIY
jgi:hypothetical protein